ncbi:MAG: ABC transporter permease [Aquabacterium sp.]
MLSTASRLAAGYGSTLLHAVARRDLLRQPDVRRALWRQIHVSGVQALPYVAVVALLFGAVVVTQALLLLGPDDDTVLKAVVWGGIRELGPLVTALILIARSGVAMAAEVALLRLRGGIHASHWHDIDDEDELVLPRVLGCAVAGAVLVSCFQFIAIAAALAASALTLGTALEFEILSFLDTAVWYQVAASIGKGLLFGAGIAAVSCWHGLQVTREVGQLPKAVVAAALGSLGFVMVVDLIALVTRLR